MGSGRWVRQANWIQRLTTYSYSARTPFTSIWRSAARSMAGFGRLTAIDGPAKYSGSMRPSISNPRMWTICFAEPTQPYWRELALVFNASMEESLQLSMGSLRSGMAPSGPAAYRKPTGPATPSSLHKRFLPSISCREMSTAGWLTRTDRSVNLRMKNDENQRTSGRIACARAARNKCTRRYRETAPAIRFVLSEEKFASFQSFRLFCSSLIRPRWRLGPGPTGSSQRPDPATAVARCSRPRGKVLRL
jgi:hypothetical protein